MDHYRGYLIGEIGRLRAALLRAKNVLLFRLEQNGYAPDDVIAAINGAEEVLGIDKTKFNKVPVNIMAMG